VARIIAGGTEGQTVAEFVAQAEARYGIGGHHAEVVARTNVQTAYQWGHYQQLTSPAVAEAFPVWGFDVVLDSGTSDICSPLANLAYPVGHAIWQSLYPPNHHQCRTRILPMASDEVAELGFRLAAGWPVYPADSGKPGAQVIPAQGFAGNVGAQRLEEI